MIKVVISGYGRMGHMVESVLKARGIECAGASEDISSFDKALAKECVCITGVSLRTSRPSWWVPPAGTTSREK